MAKYIIEHDRKSCIGCAACEAIAPEFWSISDDGKANPKSAKLEKQGTGVSVEISDNDFQTNKDAADSCPVNAIHITDEKGKRVI